MDCVTDLKSVVSLSMVFMRSLVYLSLLCSLSVTQSIKKPCQWGAGGGGGGGGVSQLAIRLKGHESSKIALFCCSASSAHY
jgi:hypothetical protein